MKKLSVLFVVTSILLTSCVGNASLWGQYLTPTPFGWVPEATSVTPDVVVPVTLTPEIISTEPAVTDPTSTSTPTALASFVTMEAVTETATDVIPVVEGDTILYYAQSGDWLPAVASRFGVEENEITSPKILPESGFIDAGTLLIIPDRLDKNVTYTPSVRLIPDSEVVFSATATGFDVEQYVKDAGGYLSTSRQYLGSTAWTSGAEAIERLADENSVNPRLLLALLDYEAQWVRGKPVDQFHTDYPMGYENYRNKGMFGQMTWAINQLSIGYYDWRMGTMRDLTFSDGATLRLDPTLNPGTVAIMTYFSRKHTLNEWLRIMDVNSGFPAFYQDMFGDPWARADAFGNLFPPGFGQPGLTLPIEPGTTWAFTGGPHSAWGTGGPLAAVDFAPENDTPGCFTTTAWVTAMSPGLVVRLAKGVVIVDLDGDGSEQTGWNILYLHVADKDKAELDQWVEKNGEIGHPSCDGGISTGTHVHTARKYNGEWMIADGPIPFVMSDWTVVAGEKPYLGKMTRGNEVVVADVYGQAWSLITREDEE